MIFFGIISSKKDFDIMKKEIEKSLKNVNLILISEDNIENLQNIKFEALIINDELHIKESNIMFFQKICENLKYLIINSDRNNFLDILNNNRLCVITYGLNHKCTVTASSITEEYVLVALQREIIDKYGNLMVIGEKRVNTVKEMDVYGVMAIFILKLIYLKSVQIWPDLLEKSIYLWISWQKFMVKNKKNQKN